MLVLSRGRDESIMVGDDVEVRILDIRGNTVRLGITAPKCIAVHRREIFEAIQRQKEQGQEAPVSGRARERELVGAHID